MKNPTITQGLLKVTWKDGNWKWYRVSGKKWSTLLHNFYKIKAFHYAKLYEFNKTTRAAGNEIGYFGVKESGEKYDSLNQ